MLKPDILFWNVDTQFDFMNPDGKLYVQGAECISSNLEKITSLAAAYDIQVVNTADHHFEDSPELSFTPDFINTFPPHCMADTKGAEFVSETLPRDAVELPWKCSFSDEVLNTMASHRNIVIRKDAFDVFAGNSNTESLLKIIAPKKVFVYGVTTNVCVHFAVIGLARRGIAVYVIEDAIKELPNIPIPFSEWDKVGIKRITLERLLTFVK